MNFKNGKAFLLYCGDGEIYINGNYKKYASNISSGSKIGILVDMYKRSLKFYLDGKD